MIPKIAHFHWTGEPSWLRMAGLMSFKRLNPDWEIRLYDTPKHIKDLNLTHPAQEGDMTRWEMLYEHGGFAIALDAIFWRPVPEEWRNGKIAGTVDRRDERIHRIFHIAMFGAEPKNLFLFECLNFARSKEAKEDGSYQSMGVELLERFFPRYKQDCVDIPNEALCWSGWEKGVERLWEPDYPEYPPEAIGVHWYGGHAMSKVMNRAARPGGASYIEQLATEELGL